MDRNQATGLILIALMVMLYFYFFAPKPEPVEENQKDTTELVEKDTVESDTDEYTPLAAEDSAQQALHQQMYGIFAKGASGTKENITIENELIKISLTNKGGKVNGVELKNFTTYYGKPLILLDEESNAFSLLANNKGRLLNIYDLYYTPSQRTEGDTTIVTFSLDIAPGQSVKHIYKLGKNSYKLSYQLKIEGLDEYVSKENLIYTWDNRLKAQEKDLAMSQNNSTINYYTFGDEFDGLAERSTDVEEESIEETLKWVAIKQRFFVSGIVAQNAFSRGRFKTSVDPADSSTVKVAQVVLSLPYEDIKAGKGIYTYYFGPNDYHILNDIADDFENNLDLGWPPMKWINRWVIIPLFDLLGRFIGNYGIIIIVMVILIKLVLSPLSYKSYLSMAKMKVLKPELDEIKEKHGEDLAKAQQEQMKLYQKVGVSPLSGCIPMLLQMPILFAMFYFFPQSIELRGESFLWAEDLSTYDSILNLPFTIPFYGDHVSLFVLLMTLSTILYTWSNQQVSTVQGPMKTFSYLMPVIFMFVLNSYPAALSFYYFVSNIVTFGQQALIRRFVDEEKIKVILEENRKKNVNKKKSKFQQRLEEAMKASQAKGKK